jgi:hypothetical protein
VAKPSIEQKKMVDILVDIHLLEAQFQNEPVQNKSRVYNTIVGYENIFAKHGVTSQEFYDSFAYYRRHPEELDALYQDVIDRVTQMESEISPEAAKERIMRGQPGRPDTARRKTGIHHQSEW